MAISIENSKGKSYFVKSKKTKRGNTTYYMTKKEDGTCLSEVPNGYEVFEKFDSNVLFIRKKKKSLFDLKEINLIKSSLRNNKGLTDFRIDTHGKILSVYTADKEMNERQFESLVKPFYSRSQIDHYRSMWIKFEERMRIIVHENKGDREYEVKRYCYKGAVDDWITIGVESDIESVVKDYLIHLGRDSYYELYGY
ncbi:MAG: hypothetical protein AAFO07_20585 [Bacteroidota bacterium]